jgi:WD40 repeat protein
MAIASGIVARRYGITSNHRFESAVSYARASSLTEPTNRHINSSDTNISSSFSSSFTTTTTTTTTTSSRIFSKNTSGSAFLCLKLDPINHRFLLSTDTRSEIQLFDTARTRNNINVNDNNEPCGFLLSKASSLSSTSSIYSDVRIPVHTSAVTTVAWYGVDCGLFVSGGIDGLILAWDSQRMLPAYSWKADNAVYCIDTREDASSTTTGTLCAVASEDPRLRLLDLRTCAFSHFLPGHTAPITCVSWIPLHEFLVASGSRDGTIRLWDVRRSGAQAQLAIGDKNALPGHSAVSLLRSVQGSSMEFIPTSSNTFTSTFRNMQQVPSASATFSPSISHTRGVNFLLPLDGLSLGDYGPGGTVPTGMEYGAPARALTSTAIPAVGSGEHHLHAYRMHLASGGSDQHAIVWDMIVANDSRVVASSGVEFFTSSNISVDLVPTPAALPPIMLSGKRCIYPAAARIGPSNASGGKHAAGPMLVPTTSPKDVVLFIPSSVTPQSNISATGAQSIPGVIECIDAATGKLLHSLKGHNGIVNAVSYRETTQELFSASSDGSIRIWESPLLNYAREKRNINNTDEETMQTEV